MYIFKLIANLPLFAMSHCSVAWLFLTVFVEFSCKNRFHIWNSTIRDIESHEIVRPIISEHVQISLPSKTKGKKFEFTNWIKSLKITINF